MIDLKLTEDEFKSLWVFCNSLQAMTPRSIRTPAISGLFEKVTARYDEILKPNGVGGGQHE